jgi:hypothetical protein
MFKYCLVMFLLITVFYVCSVFATEVCPTGQIPVCALPATLNLPTPVPVPVPPPVPPPPPTPLPASTLFSDGFETGNASRWTTVVSSAGSRDSYTQTGCHSGQWCAVRTWAGNQNDQRGEWIFDTHGYSGPSIYVSAWYNFPTDYSFTKVTTAKQSSDQKAIILETAGNRTFLNFRGGGNCAQLAAIVENAAPDAWSNGSKCIPADGQWHQVEFQVDRVSNGAKGRIRAWLDQTLAIDDSRITCSGACSPVGEIKVGAYLNGGTKAQSFGFDDVVIAPQRP